jgi:hypothetical protein
LRLTGLPSATITLQPLPVPRTVLYWTQIK